MAIPLPPDVEKQIQDRAAALGQDVTAYVRRLVEHDAQPNNGPTAPRSEAVTLGLGSTASVVGSPPRPGPVPSPRGLLPVPPEVERLIQAALDRTPTLSAAHRKLLADSYTLSYYYGGQDVAYRSTDHGVEVLAVGLKEIQELVQQLSAEELLAVLHGRPEPW